MKQRTGSNRLSSCALMCALLCVCSQIMLPFPGVPVNMALFAVHLSALLLGSGCAAASTLTYLALGACGVPVFAGFASGPAALLGPTGGFLLSYPLCALLTGFLSRRADCSALRASSAALAGMLVCAAVGIPWFMLYSGTAPSVSFFLWWLVYLPGDLLKILLAVALSRRLRGPLRRLGL
ncbi:MAG: biotin transporter BioY [Clostridia bacterium]|nr:biotin transporter BioY [Clostridia bacterium]